MPLYQGRLKPCNDYPMKKETTKTVFRTEKMFHIQHHLQRNQCTVKGCFFSISLFLSLSHTLFWIVLSIHQIMLLCNLCQRPIYKWAEKNGPPHDVVESALRSVIERKCITYFSLSLLWQLFQNRTEMQLFHMVLNKYRTFSFEIISEFIYR